MLIRWSVSKLEILGSRGCVLALVLMLCNLKVLAGGVNDTSQFIFEGEVDFDKSSSMILSEEYSRDIIALPSLPKGMDELAWMKECAELYRQQGLQIGEALSLCSGKRMGNNRGAQSGGYVPGAGGVPHKGLPDQCITADGVKVKVTDPNQSDALNSCDEGCFQRREREAAAAAQRERSENGDNTDRYKSLKQAEADARSAIEAIRSGDLAAAERARSNYRDSSRGGGGMLVERDFATSIPTPGKVRLARWGEFSPDSSNNRDPGVDPNGVSSNLPSCIEVNALQQCMKEFGGDITGCLKRLNDPVFTITGGRCESITNEVDQKTIRCKDSTKTPAIPADAICDSIPVGPGGSMCDWCGKGNPVARSLNGSSGLEGISCASPDIGGVNLIAAPEFSELLLNICNEGFEFPQCPIEQW